MESLTSKPKSIPGCGSSCSLGNWMYWFARSNRKVLIDSYSGIRAALGCIATEAQAQAPAPIPELPLSIALLPLQNSNNFSLTFSNLMETGESIVEDNPPDYRLLRERSNPNLELVVPAPISNIRSEPINMRPAWPCELELPQETTVLTKLEVQPR